VVSSHVNSHATHNNSPITVLTKNVYLHCASHSMRTYGLATSCKHSVSLSVELNYRHAIAALAL